MPSLVKLNLPSNLRHSPDHRHFPGLRRIVLLCATLIAQGGRIRPRSREKEKDQNTVCSNVEIHILKTRTRAHIGKGKLFHPPHTSQPQTNHPVLAASKCGLPPIIIPELHTEQAQPPLGLGPEPKVASGCCPSPVPSPPSPSRPARTAPLYKASKGSPQITVCVPHRHPYWGRSQHIGAGLVNVGKLWFVLPRVPYLLPYSSGTE